MREDVHTYPLSPVPKALFMRFHPPENVEEGADQIHPRRGESFLVMESSDPLRPRPNAATYILAKNPTIKPPVLLTEKRNTKRKKRKEAMGVDSTSTRIQNLVKLSF